MTMNWRTTWADTVRTEDDLIRFVNDVGCCVINTLPRFSEFPSQEVAMGLPDVLGRTWFWKDDLHIDRRIYYTRLFSGKPGFIALDLLPAFIATNGAVADELMLTGAMPANAQEIYRNIEDRGPISTRHLKALLGEDTRKAAANILIDLENKFIVTKTQITGRERGTYGYVWDLAERWMPDAFTAADCLGRKASAEQIKTRLTAFGITDIASSTKRVLRWDK